MTTQNHKDRIIKTQTAADGENNRSVLMFPVHGDSPQTRNKIINSVFTLSPMAGFLLSAVNLEWTLRRAILALGRDPTKEIRNAFKRDHGIDGYKDMWKRQVSHPFGRIGLFELVEKQSQKQGFSWNDLRRGFDVRNILVHGRSCTQGADYLRRYTDIFVKTAEIIISFVESNGKSVFKTIRRYKAEIPDNQP